MLLSLSLSVVETSVVCQLCFGMGVQNLTSFDLRIIGVHNIKELS